MKQKKVDLIKKIRRNKDTITTGGVASMPCEHCEEKSRNAPAEHTHDSQANWKHYALLAGVGMLLVLNVVQAFQIGALQKAYSPITGSVSLAGASADARAGEAGETYGEMMARMHLDQVQSAPSSGGSQMVGGC